MAALEQFQCIGVGLALWMTAGAVPDELAVADRKVVDRGLGQDGPSGIAGAEKEDVEFPL
jgi:hypothetical protein